MRPIFGKVKLCVVIILRLHGMALGVDFRLLDWKVEKVPMKQGATREVPSDPKTSKYI
jgi:hypothetical protein